MKDFKIPTEFLESEEFKKHKAALEGIRERDDDAFETSCRKETAKVIFDDISRIIKKRLNEYFGSDCRIDYDTIYNSPSLEDSNRVEDVNVFIWQRSFLMCNNLSISSELFQPLALDIIIHIIENREPQALKLFEAMLYPFYYAEEKAFFSVNLGRSGGRPQHKHKAETMEMADNIITSNKSLSIDEISVAVYQKMSSRYTDCPKLLTIRNWLIKSI